MFILYSLVSAIWEGVNVQFTYMLAMDNFELDIRDLSRASCSPRHDEIYQHVQLAEQQIELAL